MQYWLVKLSIFSMLLACSVANAGVAAFAQPSGSQVIPSVSSSGSSDLEVGFDPATHELTVDGNFLNLNGNVTGVYIHCCGAQPGTLPVATNLLAGIPIGQPSGVTDTSYVYKTDSGNFWESGFLGAGDTANAESRLENALRNQWAYISIRSKRPDAPSEVEEMRGLLVNRPNIAEWKSADGKIASIYMAGSKLYPKGVPINDSLKCHRQSVRCIVPVYARKFIESGMERCESRLDFDQLMVYKNTQIVWLLVNGDVNDRTEFRFSPYFGHAVSIGTPANPVGQPQHDQTKDFSAPGNSEPKDTRQFKWKSVADPTRIGLVFNYTIRVDRWDERQSLWVPCRSADPRIVNRN